MKKLLLLSLITVLGCSNLAIADVFSPPSPWKKKGTTINYGGGNVGIGTVNPTAALEVNGVIKGTGSLPTGAVFFMAAGSCPSWTTDISGTYANKYVKINSTQLTSAGVVLTGNTSGYALTASDIPPLPIRTNIGSASFGSVTVASSNGSADNTFSGLVNNGVTAAAHVHALSSASTLEPSSITMKACQVN
jgi:hypothetical protein